MVDWVNRLGSKVTDIRSELEKLRKKYEREEYPPEEFPKGFRESDFRRFESLFPEFREADKRKLPPRQEPFNPFRGIGLTRGREVQPTGEASPELRQILLSAQQPIESPLVSGKVTAPMPLERPPVGEIIPRERYERKLEDTREWWQFWEDKPIRGLPITPDYRPPETLFGRRLTPEEQTIVSPKGLVIAGGWTLGMTRLAVGEAARILAPLWRASLTRNLRSWAKSAKKTIPKETERAFVATASETLPEGLLAKETLKTFFRPTKAGIKLTAEGMKATEQAAGKVVSKYPLLPRPPVAPKVTPPLLAPEVAPKGIVPAVPEVTPETRLNMGRTQGNRLALKEAGIEFEPDNPTISEIVSELDKIQTQIDAIPTRLSKGPKFRKLDSGRVLLLKSVERESGLSETGLRNVAEGIPPPIKPPVVEPVVAPEPSVLEAKQVEYTRRIKPFMNKADAEIKKVNDEFMAGKTTLTENQVQRDVINSELDTQADIIRADMGVPVSKPPAVTPEVAPVAPEPTISPVTEVTEGITPPPIEPPVVPPTIAEIPEATPPSGRPRTLLDLNREAKGMRALTPEQRATIMDVARPIKEGELLWKVKPFKEHAENLLQPDTPFKQFLRDIPGLKQIVGLWTPAQMERNNPIAMIGIRKAIFEEIETGRARQAALAWWNDAEELFGFKKIKGKWQATKLQVDPKADTKKPYFNTIHDIIEHPENYVFTQEQGRIIQVALDMQTQVLRDAQRVGINAIELTGDYWRRIVTKGPKDKIFTGSVSNRISGRKGYTMQRAFEFVDEGATLGFEYETHPLATLENRLESGIRTISDQEMRREIMKLPGVEKPLERLESRYPQTIEGQKVAREARDLAKETYLKDKSVENITALRQSEADYITAMREVFQKKLEAGQAGYYELKLPNGRIAPAELVEEVKKWIDLPEIRTGAGAISNMTLEISRLVRTTLTNVDLAAGFIQGQILFYRNNPAWWVAQSKALTALVGDPTAYVKKNFALMDEGMRMGAISIPTEFMFARQGVASIPTRIPVIGVAMRSFNRAFEWFILSGQTELYKATRSGALRRATGEITPAGVELQKEATDALVSLGSAIRKELGTESYAILGVRPNQRTVEQLVAFAARFFRANTGIMAQTFTGGEGGREARRAMGSLIVGGLALLTAITWFQDRKLPNVTDPFAPDWMQFRVGKTYFSVLGPFHPYFRTIARMSVYNAQMKPDLAARELKNFLTSKAGIPFRAADIAGQFAFKGKLRTWEGEVIPRTPLGIVRGVLGELAVPISIQEALESIPQGRPEAAIAEIWGLIGRGSPYNQMDILFQLSPDINPEQISYRYAEPWQEEEMEKRYPDIAKLMVGRGRGVWADASQMWAEVDGKYYKQEEALATEFETQVITPDQFREQYSKIQAARINEKAGINKTLDLFQDERDLPDEPNERALAEYYIIYDKATLASGRLNWDIVDALEAYYEGVWTDEQKAFVGRNTGLRRHPPLILEYIEVKERLKPYWELPNKPASVRQTYRRDNPDIDAILVKWYGYKPSKTVLPGIFRPGESPFRGGAAGNPFR